MRLLGEVLDDHPEAFAIKDPRTGKPLEATLRDLFDGPMDDSPSFHLNPTQMRNELADILRLLNHAHAVLAEQLRPELHNEPPEAAQNDYEHAYWKNPDGWLYRVAFNVLPRMCN